jgi:hypothetical protein
VLLGALALIGLVVAVSGGATSTTKSKFTAAQLTPDSTYTGAKSISGSLARTDPSLLGKTSSAPVNVLIKYDYDATATYGGGESGLAATSPRVTGKSLKANASAVRAYEQHTAQVSSTITAAVEKAVAGADVTQTYQTAYGGVAATVPANSVEALLKVDGVAAVQKDTLEQPQTSVTPEFMGATAVWPSIGGPTHAGENVVVGVIDSGVWPEHPSFQDHGLPAPPGGPYACQFGDGSDVAHLGPTFACNRKLVGAYALTQGYMNAVTPRPGANENCNPTTRICSARDSEGHGTHTASTAVGDRVESVPLYGANRGPISGMAPGARLIAYRVCLSEGCFQSDSVAAVQQAIKDGVNVINFSISGGANPYSDAVEIAFLDAFNAGISVNASAGNAGPGAATVDHGGPWVTTVGASTSPRFFSTTLHLTADGGATFDVTGYSITNGVTAATPVILAESIPGENALCETKLTTTAQIAAVTGKVVACRRSAAGGNGRLEKSFNVQPAAGMILYNPVKQDVETDNHFVPTVHVDGPPTALLAFINGHTNVKAQWAQAQPTPTKPDVITSFSSRGPQADFIKPDVTAPGVQVLAGATPVTDGDPLNGKPGNLFQAIAGTSMSSPHSAGASAVVKAAHPDWTPAMIKSALMTSAETNVVKDDGVTPADPFDDGAGSIRINRAVDPTLVFDETFEDYVASAFDPLHRIDLNIPSVDAPTMTGEITTTRTATNVSGGDFDAKVIVDAPQGAEILVSSRAPGANGAKGDRSIHFSRKTTDLWITIKGAELANGQYFGRITLDPNGSKRNPVTIPVAFFKRQGAVTLTHDCEPTTFPRKTGAAHCIASVTNFSSVAADVNLEVTNLDRGKLDFTNISAPATAIKKDDGVQWSGTLTPAVPPAIDGIEDITGDGPDGGYLDLSLLGVGPVPGVGDDTITNFNVPTFYYGAESYTSIGVVSNGYVVIGGGNAADIVFKPQTFPNTARPNNVLALMWSDLNPSAAGAGEIRVATLNAGPAFRWLVVDWAGVKNFGNATTHSFELWIQLPSSGFGTGPESEGITYSYGPNTTFPGDGPGLGNAGSGDPDSGQNWGAENRAGTSGQNISPAPPNGSEWFVETSPPTAGGSASVLYDASSRQAGTYKSQASMTSNVTPGTTQVVKTLTVTN